MTTTFSLGALLRASLAAGRQASGQQLNSYEEDDTRRLQIATPQAFFAHARELFFGRIVAGLPPGVVSLRDTPVADLFEAHRWSQGLPNPHVAQPHFAAWQEFQFWATSNGLRASWVTRRDRQNRESHALQVVPA